MQQAPKFLILGLQTPAIHLGWIDWDMSKRVFINGREAQGNDTPWCALVADLLIDHDERKLVGVSFAIAEVDFYEPMRRLAQRLDSSLVRYNDLTQERDKQLYPDGESGRVHRFEIYWSAERNLGFELAQILCGQWFWWYAPTGEPQEEWPVIAFGIGDVDELIIEHGLTCPDLQLPTLDVQFV